MPWFGFIHPALALFTLFYGLRIGQTSLTKLADWDFPLRVMRARTLRYFLLTVANLILGFVFQIVLAAQGRPVRLLGHLPLAIAVVLLTLFADLATFGRQKPGELPRMIRWHPILVIASLALILTMGFTGLLKLFRL
ncbi:MAG: hypothetical protein ABIK44_01880 [candidate division WOR-3 bacterium]